MCSCVTGTLQEDGKSCRGKYRGQGGHSRALPPPKWELWGEQWERGWNVWCTTDRRGVEGREPAVPCPCHLRAVRALLALCIPWDLHPLAKGEKPPKILIFLKVKQNNQALIPAGVVATGHKPYLTSHPLAKKN